MTSSPARRLCAAGLAAAAALALAGCNSMTYGTGKSPGIQTLEDITGIVALTKPKEDPINYGPRAKIVAPPPQAAATLPPPESQPDSGKALNPNWPKDPDQEYARFRADVAAAEAAGKPLPKITMTPEMLAAAPAAPSTGTTAGPMSKADRDRIRKSFADAKASLAVDENGNPVRRYLSDPPVTYRAPDPESTVDANAPPEKNKKKKKTWWPW